MVFSKFKILLVLFVSLILLTAGAGCDTSSAGLKSFSLGNSGGSRSVTKEDDFSGTKGLNIQFMVVFTATEIYKDSPFSIGFTVKNEGAFDVQDGAVCFGSLSEDVFSKPDTCLPLGNLYGRRNMIGGESKEYIEEGYNFKLDYRLDTNYPIKGKACYSYEMNIPFSVCLKSLEVGAENSCNTGMLTLTPSSQGGPIQIVSIKEDIIPTENQNEIMLTILLKNTDAGKVYDSSSISSGSCPSISDSAIKNKAKITVSLPGEYGTAKCTPANYAMFDNSGNAKVICKEIYYEKDKSYPLEANINLKFGYVIEKEGTFKLKAKMNQNVV